MEIRNRRKTWRILNEVSLETDLIKPRTGTSPPLEKAVYWTLEKVRWKFEINVKSGAF